ncbi:RelA/SpoT family protein [Coralliovum pocilloporae]|uniref:RelA/SpoT family protein n=1 Tax=Coralliovum pocilloporae TaxID=3066369 RepID=UPI003307AEF1
MMRQYELVERATSYNPHADELLLNKAYVYAMQKHGSQTRASGDPYFSHPLEVAAILADLKVDDATIVVALLHDTIEDTDATRAEIDDVFGHDIGKLVEGLTKIERLDLMSKKAAQAENLRKLLLAISDDVRVLLVKLGDRLHNMRTLHHVPPHKRTRISEETLEIYAPLAGRMGMQDMREELEDLSFRYVNPDAYEAIVERLSDLREKNRPFIEEIQHDLLERLEQNGISAVVKAREKRPYSIFRKTQKKSLSFEQLSDIFGFRIMVDTIPACYQALGIVHSSWSCVPGQFKDYISTPKQNDYQSIHTTVVGTSRQRVELQIRTRDMDQIAEYGIAAHALYKDREGEHAQRLSSDSRAYEWLRRSIEILAQGDSPEAFLENTKLELFHDQVFCFTPKGRLIALPKGATPIDFAYAVHTDVGNTAVGSKVNGHIRPLVTELMNGDEVEIIRSNAQTPPSAWENIAVTGKARAAIRRATREAVRQQYADLGRQILTHSFERYGKPFSEEAFGTVAPRLGHANIEDCLAAVGRGEITSRDVVRVLYPDYQDERVIHQTDPNDTGWVALDGKAGMKMRVEEAGSNGTRSIPVRGIRRGLPVSFAPEGGAVPGDRIVGILSPGEGVTIYPIQSPALQEFDDEPDRWVDVRWDIDEDNPERFPARVHVTVINEPGTLAQISAVIGTNDGNIDNLHLSKRASDFADIVIDLEVWDLKHLSRIIHEIHNLEPVSSVNRVNG